MNWHDLGPGRGVLEFDAIAGGDLPAGDRLEFELLVYWGAGEPTRAVWVWSQTGAIAGWCGVGEG